MAERYKCTLSPEAMQKATAELNEPEDNAVRLAAIDKLRNRFQDECKELKLVRSDDAFILRFLRVRKYNEDRAFQTLKNYHIKREESREIFDLVDSPKQIEDFIKSGALLTLREGRAKDGTFVLYGKPGHGYKGSGDFVKFVALVILSLEKILENEESQVYGLTIINDVSELKVSYVPFMATYARTISSILQESMPIRIKSMDMVNESAVIDVLYAVITRFMTDKLKNRLQLHGSSFKALHDKVDSKYLPFALGGTGPDLNGSWWAEQIISSVGAGEDTAL